MPRTILIVDDNALNRQLLNKILSEQYTILEAFNGKDALAVMQKAHDSLSAVLLDLIMPEMDGYEVLKNARDDYLLSQIPIIIITGSDDEQARVKALSLGASDFIQKPYNPEIIRHCLSNNITLRETTSIINTIQRDKLTGLYNRETFLEKVQEQISAREPGYYVMSCLNINNFKVINDQYGSEAGDNVLKHIADGIRSYMEGHEGICCRLSADNFGMLYPQKYMDSEEIRQRHASVMTPQCLNRPISIRIGRNIVSDTTLPAGTLYDRALMAQTSIKGKYGQYVALYDESMREHLLYEQQIVSDMDAALKRKQFEVWFQPQYNHVTGAHIGAEALVRWRHPQMGLIPPSDFIPVFEENGFIYELDKYVWEETCRLLRKWADEGRPPLPVSVNISRFDVFSPDFMEVICGLVEKYGIPVELLRLEITESAFAEATNHIVEIAKKLINCGFTLEIDDFGSGYSSLNTLKNVPAQIVKLDLRFLEEDGGTGRGGNIIESIVRMTKWLGMSVIAEGVETKAQADYLASIGCSYVQGYLYAHPMTTDEYETNSHGAVKEERLLTIETVENLDSSSFWDPKSMDTLIFNSYVGAACIFEYYDKKIELLRANEKFARILGDGTMSVEDTLKLDWLSCLTRESLENVRNILRRSGETGRDFSAEYVFQNIPGGPSKTYLRATMRVIATAGKRQLVYCISENITAQRQAEESERRATKQLQSVMDNVNCGITAAVARDGGTKLLIANNKYFELFGYTREQYNEEISGPFDLICPEDIRQVQYVYDRVRCTRSAEMVEYRAMRRDGSVIWLRSSVSMTDFEGENAPVQLGFITDITAERQAAQELLDNLPGGAALYEFDGSNLTLVLRNRRYWELVGRDVEELSNFDALDDVHADDREMIGNELRLAVKQGRDAELDVRLLCGKNEYGFFHITGRILQKGSGKYSVYVTYTPLSDEELTIRETLPVALRTMMDTQSDFSFVKDKNLRYVCCSRSVYESSGLHSEAEMIGKSDYDILEKAKADEFRAADLFVMESGKSVVDKQFLLPSTDGKEHYSSTSKYPLKDSKGNIIGIYGVGRDITEARRMKSQLELLTNNVPGGIAVFEGDPNELGSIKLTYFSDGYCRLFGYTREEYEKRAEANVFGLVFAGDMRPMFEQVKRLVLNDEPMDCVYRARTKDGGFKWINVKGVKGEMHGDRMTVNAVLIDVTEQQNALEHLRISEEENRLAIQHSRSVVCRFDVGTRTLSVPEPAAHKYMVPKVIENLPEGPVSDGSISPDTAAEYVAFYNGILRGEPEGKAIFKRKSTSGWRYLEAQYSTIYADNKAPASAVISFADVTEELEKEAVYKRWQQSINEKRLEDYTMYRCNISKNTAFDSSGGKLLKIKWSQGELTFDERTEEYAEQCVYDEDQESFLAFIRSDTLLAGYYRGKRSGTLEYREKQTGGCERWLRLTVELAEYPNSSDVEAYLLFENIDESKRSELRTLERAETDPLTGVLNRATFATRADRLIASAKPHTQFALLMIDIDGFKLINDAFGHSAGDQTLIETASLLRSTLRKGDLLGRLGGDEFVIFLSDVPNDAAAATKSKHICNLIRKSFSAEIEISGSIGIAMIPKDGKSFETLYKKSDAALYFVKGSGKDNYAFYHEDMCEEHLRRAQGQSSPEDGAKKKKRRMLIVDDNNIDYAMMANIFENDFIIDKANDGNLALIRLRHYGSAISVVLLDFVMPGMDGLLVLRRMQESAELRNIPVVVVSAVDDNEASLKAIKSGASDFVAKPVDPALLRVRVESAISKAENERLRAKNSLLEYQNQEVTRYKTLLAHSGMVFAELDWITGAYTYDPLMSHYINGVFDDRGLWHILLADLTADTVTVQKLQDTVRSVAEERDETERMLIATLKTPTRAHHRFRIHIYKSVDDYGLTSRIYMTFTDIDAAR